MEEIWKDVPGYEGFYIVSNYGNVRSVESEYYSKGKMRKKRDRELVKSTSCKGYKLVYLSNGKKFCRLGVHQVVAMAFHGHKIDSGMIIDHINGVVDDNRASNIRVVTRRFNNSYGYRNFINPKKSKYIGVTKNKSCKSWVAYITINKKRIHLGSFSNEDDAGRAYINALLSIT